MGKGATWERKFSKDLSLWWTEGANPDVFWRSQASGGRATIRRKAGKTLNGQEGDITATDPIGKPLIDVFSIELKCGYGNWSAMDFLETSQKDPTLLQFVKQAKEQAKKEWLLVYKKDRKNPMVVMEQPTFAYMSNYCISSNCFRAELFFSDDMTLVVLPLEKFFGTDPTSFRLMLKDCYGQ